MNYEVAAHKYLELRRAKEAMDNEHKRAKAELVEKMTMLENWFTAKAAEEGLNSIPTPFGTAYWSTHHSATVASRDELFNYCKKNDTWDLLESRASKTAVKSFIEAHGAPPPGVNFNSVSVFNFRAAQSTGE
jgi:hypothetical protein